MDVLQGIGRFFYIINPAETFVQNTEDVPDYEFTKGIPFYITFIFLEIIVQILKKKPMSRFNDSVVSLSHGIYFVCAKVLVRGAEVYAYMHIYAQWRIYDLPWDSAITWYVAALGVDFIFYWIHRISHEINILWGAHQVHHSSEDFNLTTALRQSGIQGCFNWIFYLPLALIVPPSIFLIHQQFNFMYQFWIHTELVESIGPLEYILNTPKHHRIHHGSNRYCLDKNYGGVLIIWDRIFGTFAEEKPNEKIIFGLVEHVSSFNSFFLQFYYFPRMWERMSHLPRLMDKLSVIFKGPSWEIGKPRLGIPEERLLFPVREKFDATIPAWHNAYISIHFVVIVFEIDALLKQYLVMSQVNVLCFVAYILFSLSSIGFILENRGVAWVTEVLRCTIGFLAVYSSMRTTESFQRNLILIFFGTSICIWITLGLHTPCSLFRLNFIEHGKECIRKLTKKFVMIFEFQR